MDLNNHFNIHEKSLQLRDQRTNVLASNLANADTPGYKARDIDFKAVLGDLQNKDMSAMMTTNQRHISESETMSDSNLKYRIPLQSSLDGNTVDTQVESAKFSENSIRYLASLRFVGAKINNLLTAIRGE